MQNKTEIIMSPDPSGKERRQRQTQKKRETDTQAEAENTTSDLLPRRAHTHTHTHTHTRTHAHAHTHTHTHTLQQQKACHNCKKNQPQSFELCNLRCVYVLSAVSPDITLSGRLTTRSLHVHYMFTTCSLHVLGAGCHS